MGTARLGDIMQQRGSKDQHTLRCWQTSPAIELHQFCDYHPRMNQHIALSMPGWLLHYPCHGANPAKLLLDRRPIKLPGWRLGTEGEKIMLHR
jgi:hypothetical protein